STILKGITRDSLIQIARALGYEVSEQDVMVNEIIDGIRNGSVTEVFGAGTAVVVSPFSAIGYEGTDYELPAISEDSVSTKLMNSLNDIRTGKVADTNGWVWKVS